MARYDGAQQDAPVEGLAKLLVPKGIDPARIASLRFWGLYSGSLSWCQSTIDSFTAMLQEDDPNVKAVGAAGVELFSRQRDQAARNVRENRPMNWGMSGAGDLAQAKRRYADEQKVHCITCSQDAVFPGRSPPHTY